MVPHPQDESRPLFLSFDYCHIIKNVRNQFLARQFEFGKKIEKRYIELLYEQQKTELLRPLRRMGLKTLDPNNLEKQNVQLALDIFSMEVTSLLESKLFNAESEFEGCEETLTFLRNFTKWFAVHDVSNTTQHVRQRLPDKMHFTSVDDERLKWLEGDFLSYLKTWKESTKGP